MKSGGISSKQKVLYAILISAGLLYGAYSLFISDNITKYKDKTAESVKLEATLSEIQQYVDNRDVYRKAIETNNEAITETVNKYYDTVSNKDLIAYTDYIDKTYNLDTRTFTMNDIEIIKKIDYSYGENKTGVVMINRRATSTYGINSYQNLKTYLRDLQTQTLGDTVLRELTISYAPEDDAYQGNFSFFKKAIYDSERIDDSYDVSYINTGVNNIFGGN